MKKILIASFSLFVVISCTKSNFNETTTSPPPPIIINHTITSINPVRAQYGNTVTIKGTNFGTIASILQVTINGTVVPISTVIDTDITVTIPVGLGSGVVAVKKNTTNVNGPSFEYLYTGNVTTIAGSATATAPTGTNPLAVGFNQPTGIALDAAGNLFVADFGASHIRKITPAGVVTISSTLYLAGANINPTDFAIAANGMQYGCVNQHAIVNYTANGFSTVAGNYQAFYLDGPNTILGNTPAAAFNAPSYLTSNGSNELFIADTYNYCIRKVVPGPGGITTTFAGLNIQGDLNANGTAARFNQPYGIIFDANNNLLVCDAGVGKIKKITATKDVTTLAGTTVGFADGLLATAKFNSPVSLAYDNAQNLVVADLNNTIRCISPSGYVYTVAGIPSLNAGTFADGVGTAARFNFPFKIIYVNGKTFYISDTGNKRIRKLILE